MTKMNKSTSNEKNCVSPGDSHPKSPSNGCPDDTQKALLPAKNSDSVDSYKSLSNPCDVTEISHHIVAKGSELTEEVRETWGNKLDFLLSIIGFAVDLANVWRFPYFCYKNGGGAFLIPYFTMLIFGALPLFFMELVLGQFHRKGAIAVWSISPIFKGIGMAQCFIAYLVAFYYNVVIAWSFFYLFASFQWELPWRSCDNNWNSYRCVLGDTNNSANLNVTHRLLESHVIDTECLINEQLLTGDAIEMSITNGTATEHLFLNKSCAVSASEEYFERRVLGLHESSGLTDLGPPRWQLVLCLSLVFTLLYFSLWKGVKSSGKVVYVTATMPYVVLSILLVRGLFLPGALDGILYFVTPRIHKLAEPTVWTDAAQQIFYSVGAGFGVHIAYASYNKFNNNCYLDCLCTAFVNSATSIFSGFVVFSYLGYMAHERGVAIDDVNESGPGLVFKVYPEAIALLPGSSVWSIIFFIMLLTLGLDSAMGGLEAVLTGIRDECPLRIRKYKYSREIFTFFVVASAGMFAMQNVTKGGMYLFTIWDTFAAGTSLLLVVFAQAIAVSWFYGLNQFVADIKKMLGFTPNLYWRLCWKFISPAFLLIVITAGIIFYAPLEYNSRVVGHYVFPGWANGVGWIISMSSMIMVPAYAIYKFVSTSGPFKQRLALCISPIWEHQAILEGKPVKRFHWRHWITLGGSNTDARDAAHVPKGQPV